MKPIITVYDVIEIPNKGVVLGGINQQLDSLSIGDIRQLVGSEIEVRNSNGTVLKSPVIDVDASSSLVGKKNIFILIPRESVQGNIYDAIQSGALLYNTEPEASKLDEAA
jgi:hypothetical protein